MSPPAADAAPAMIRPTRRILLAAIAGICLLTAAIIAIIHAGHDRALRHALLATPPDAVAAQPALVRFAMHEATPLYAAHCAACHGATMQGRPERGAPNLTDPHWLFGTGRVSDIERTILFGIRAGNGKARNVAEMPAFGQAGLLQAAEIRNVVGYLQSLNHRPVDPGMAADGKAVYFGRGNCTECHGGDARGNPDYGAPDLTSNDWTNGGDTRDLYDSIFYGRHNICPGWYGILTLSQIRALAVDIHAASHPATPGGA